MDTVFPDILDEIDTILAEGTPVSPGLPDLLLARAEAVLEAWLDARGEAAEDEVRCAPRGCEGRIR